MEWDRILKDSVQDGVIRELHLRNIPTLKTCDDWNKVKEIGYIDHKTKYAHYKGALVRYGERIFYVNEERIHALKPYRKWNFPITIRVIKDEKKKKTK